VRLRAFVSLVVVLFVLVGTRKTLTLLVAADSISRDTPPQLKEKRL
jgi:hypothetical protein